MKEITLEAELRTGSGKSVTRKMRVEGKLPAVLYGLDKKPQMLGIDRRELTKLLHASGGENVLVDLAVSKSNVEKVLVKDVQHHPVTEKIVHVDFLRIDLTKKIVITVPVHITGTAEGVKGGGILEFVSRELEVSCLPMDIPSNISIDVSQLGIHDSIHVRDIKVEGIEIVTDKDRTVVTVAAPTVIKETTPAAEGAEGAAAAEPSEPEVITEKKKKDDEEEGKEGKDKKK